MLKLLRGVVRSLKSPLTSAAVAAALIGATSVVVMASPASADGGDTTPRNLSVIVNGHGSVESDPPAILVDEDPSSQTETFNVPAEGIPLTLTATADPGWLFMGWDSSNSDCNGKTNVCEVTLTDAADVDITANFFDLGEFGDFEVPDLTFDHPQWTHIDTGDPGGCVDDGHSIGLTPTRVIITCEDGVEGDAFGAVTGVLKEDLSDVQGGASPLGQGNLWDAQDLVTDLSTETAYVLNRDEGFISELWQLTDDGEIALDDEGDPVAISLEGDLTLENSINCQLVGNGYGFFAVWDYCEGLIWIVSFETGFVTELGGAGIIDFDDWKYDGVQLPDREGWGAAEGGNWASTGVAEIHDGQLWFVVPTTNSTSYNADNGYDTEDDHGYSVITRLNPFQTGVAETLADWADAQIYYENDGVSDYLNVFDIGSSYEDGYGDHGGDSMDFYKFIWSPSQHRWFAHASCYQAWCSETGFDEIVYAFDSGTADVSINLDGGYASLDENGEEEFTGGSLPVGEVSIYIWDMGGVYDHFYVDGSEEGVTCEEVSVEFFDGLKCTFQLGPEGASVSASFICAVSDEDGSPFEVTGSDDGYVGFDSGTYTEDSDWGTAAVHAGLIDVGEVAQVQLTGGAWRSHFDQNTANGVTTSDWPLPWCTYSLELADDGGAVDDGRSTGAGGNSNSRTETVAGPNRVETAVAISQRYFDASVTDVFVATSVTYPDALSASAAAGARSGPVLLVEKDLLPGSVVAELRRLTPKRIVIVGGLEAVSRSTEDALTEFGVPVVRVGGSDRYATSVLVSQSEFPTGAAKVYIASGGSFADALSAGPAAGRTGPILLVEPNRVSAGVLAELKRLDPSQIVVLGGVASVSEEVQASVSSAVPSASVTRLGGSDRYETSALIATELFSARVNVLFLASGEEFADSLSAGPAQME